MVDLVKIGALRRRLVVLAKVTKKQETDDFTQTSDASRKHEKRIRNIENKSRAKSSKAKKSANVDEEIERKREHDSEKRQRSIEQG